MMLTILSRCDHLETILGSVLQRIPTHESILSVHVHVISHGLLKYGNYKSVYLINPNFVIF